MSIEDEIAGELALAETLDRYVGEWVAVEAQRVIDHDPDFGALVQRVPDTAVIFQPFSGPFYG